MSTQVIVGINWGDEGKGRMVDYFAHQAQYVVRFQGGSNAGHTVINHFGTFKLHLIPSGIFQENTINIVGTGCVVHLESLAQEILALRERGIRVDQNNLKISNRATIAFPYHTLQDTLQEESLGKNKFGSTRQGIAPCYGDRVMKFGVQMEALLHPEFLKTQLEHLIPLKNKQLGSIYGSSPLCVEEIFSWCMKWGEILKGMIGDTIPLLQEAEKKNENILLEAQLGSLRDLYYGIYPYTTSSCTLASHAFAGAGFWPQKPVQVIGIMKAFSSCVGEGPFISEMNEEESKELREHALEFGAKTGRPRRMGHFDAVASRFGAMVQGAHELVITKLDSLSGRKKLKICYAYKIKDTIRQDFPTYPELILSEPLYEEWEGWDEDISHIRSFGNLPLNAQKYILRIEELVGVPVKWISVGPEREALMIK